MRLTKAERDRHTALREQGKKQCSKCRQILPIEEFRPDMAKRDGLAMYCRPCNVTYQKEWSTQHREKIRLYNLERYDALRAQVSEQAKRARKAKWIDITIRQLKSKCIKRDLPYDLDQHLPQLRDRFNRGVCEMTGVPFRSVNESASGSFLWNTPSVDRINPELGYVYTNVRLIIWLMNASLGTWGEDHLEEVMRKWLANKL